MVGNESLSDHVQRESEVPASMTGNERQSTVLEVGRMRIEVASDIGVSGSGNGILQVNTFDVLPQDSEDQHGNDVVLNEEEGILDHTDDMMNDGAWQYVGNRSRSKGKGAQKGNGHGNKRVTVRMNEGMLQRRLRSNARKGPGPHG